MTKERKHGALTPAQAQQLDDLLQESTDLFSQHRWDLGQLDPKFGTCEITIIDDSPVHFKPPKMSWLEREWLKEDLQEMLRWGVIRKSDSKAGWPVRYAPKPDGTRRLCVNFSGLNKRSAPESWPLPNLEQTLMEMDNPLYFTTIDLTQSFFQVTMHPDSVAHTAMLTPLGCYEWLRMPMGYQGSPAVYSRAMDRVLETLPIDPRTGQPFHKVFIDDLVIFSRTWEDHLDHLRRTLARLREVGLKLRYSKCEWAFDTISYLGHVIDRQGVRVDPDKVSAIQALPPPGTSAGVTSFLAMAGYFRGHLKDFARVSHPLRTRETVQGSRLPWTAEQLAAYDAIKHMLTSAPCLRRPDFTKPFFVHCDWSKHAMGAVLMQQSPDPNDPAKLLDHPVRFASRVCTTPESNLSPTHGEAACVCWALDKFRPYIYGMDLTVITDHHCLIHLMSPTVASAKLQRWAARLDEYGNFRIVYRKGPHNVVPDHVSRYASAGDAVLAVLLAENRTSVVCAVSPSHTVREDLTDAQNSKYATCRVCKHPDGARNMLICDGCNELVHRSCANPFNMGPAVGDFYCSKCDPHHILALREYYEPDPAHTYHPEDPYRDTELLAYLRGELRSNKASAVHKRSERVRFHPDLPGFLQCAYQRNRSTKWLTVPPVEYRKALIQEAHAECGHGGRRLTYRQLKQRYTWRGMTQDIKEHLNSCHECQLARAHLSQPAPVKEADPVLFGQHWHMDLLGPFAIPVSPHDSHGKAKGQPAPSPITYHVFVAVEALSRWTELVIIRDKTPESTTFAFYQSVMCRHGLPATITTDRGGEFASVFDGMCNNFHIVHRRTAPRHPQSNGIAERTVGKVKKTLYALANGQPSAWPRLLPRVQYLLNTTVHSSTGYTPYELIYGRTPVVSPDLSRFIPPDTPSTEDPCFPYGVHYVASENDTDDSRFVETALAAVRNHLFRTEGAAYLRNIRSKQRHLERMHHKWVKTKQAASPPARATRCWFSDPLRFPGNAPTSVAHSYLLIRTPRAAWLSSGPALPQTSRHRNGWNAWTTSSPTTSSETAMTLHGRPLRTTARGFKNQFLLLSGTAVPNGQSPRTCLLKGRYVLLRE